MKKYNIYKDEIKYNYFINKVIKEKDKYYNIESNKNHLKHLLYLYFGIDKIYKIKSEKVKNLFYNKIDKLY